MIIDKATASDITAVCDIDRTVIGNDGRQKYLSKTITEGKCVTAKIENITVGFAVFDISFFGFAFISLVIVSPEYRRQGVGSGLIKYIESICPTEKLFTSTNESNIVMQKVSESVGFVRSGLIENLDEGDPEILYFKHVRK